MTDREDFGAALVAAAASAAELVDAVERDPSFTARRKPGMGLEEPMLLAALAIEQRYALTPQEAANLVAAAAHRLLRAGGQRAN